VLDRGFTGQVSLDAASAIATTLDDSDAGVLTALMGAASAGAALRVAGLMGAVLIGADSPVVVALPGAAQVWASTVAEGFMVEVVSTEEVVVAALTAVEGFTAVVGMEADGVRRLR
jgi:hypothetical protein